MSLSPAPDPSDALWSFLWGKRRSRRQPLALGVRLGAMAGSPCAQTCDVSRHGVLLRALTADLTDVGSEMGSDLADVGALLGQGFEMEFEAGVRSKARLVRMSWRPQDPDAVYLGCSFDVPLGTDALARLGLARRDCPPETGTTTPAAAHMSHVADPHRPLTLRVLDDTGAEVLGGPLIALEGAAVGLHLMDVDPTAVVAQLSGRENPIAVALPSAPAWLSRAYLVAVRLLNGRNDAVEVVLSVTPPPSDALLAHFARRRSARGSARRRAKAGR